MFEPVLPKNLEDIVIKKLNEIQIQQKTKEPESNKESEENLKSVIDIDLILLQAKKLQKHIRSVHSGWAHYVQIGEAVSL